MEPVWQLLRSKQNDDQWNPLLRCCLRSALANRQYPQCRVRAAGWSLHDRCLFCLNEAIEGALSCCEREERRRKIEEEGKAKSCRRNLLLEANPEILANTPKGTIGHRIYVCPRLKGSRCKHAGDELVKSGIANPGTLDFDRAMRQRPPKSTIQRSRVATFLHQ